MPASVASSDRELTLKALGRHRLLALHLEPIGQARSRLIRAGFSLRNEALQQQRHERLIEERAIDWQIGHKQSRPIYRVVPRLALAIDNYILSLVSRIWLMAAFGPGADVARARSPRQLGGWALGPDKEGVPGHYPLCST
jgi:hypothetical protein